MADGEADDVGLDIVEIAQMAVGPVEGDARRRGFGSLVLQAVKGACYGKGQVPAARTGMTNLASQATLRRAGLRECGFVLAGRVAGP